MAYELPGDRLRIERLDIPGISMELGIGWFAQDAYSRVVVGIIQEQTLGQTYYIARHENDNCIVRRWIPPYDLLVNDIPWAVVSTEYYVPQEVIAAIPLDHRHPEPNMLARLYDGSDPRVYAFDANLQQWRYVPDYGTFQAMGFYECDVTSADATFYERITIGLPFPSSGTPILSDYPNCSTG